MDKAGRRRSLLEEESQKLMGALEEATQVSRSLLAVPLGASVLWPDRDGRERRKQNGPVFLPQRLAQLKRDRQALQQELSKPVVPLN